MQRFHNCIACYSSCCRLHHQRLQPRLQIEFATSNAKKKSEWEKREWEKKGRSNCSQNSTPSGVRMHILKIWNCCPTGKKKGTKLEEASSKWIADNRNIRAWHNDMTMQWWTIMRIKICKLFNYIIKLIKHNMY